MFHSLQQRIVLLTASMIILTGIGLTTLTLYDGYIVAKRHHLTELEATVIEAGSLVESDLYRYNVHKLRNAALSIRSGRKLEYLWVLDRSGRLITDGSKSPVLRNQRPDSPFIEQLIATTETIHHDGENHLWAGHPITITETEVLGYVVAATRQEQFDVVVNKQLRKYFLLLTPVLLLSVVLAVLLGWRISRPLSKITQVARQISKGDLEIRAAKGGFDEVCILSDTINEMADRLSEKIIALQKSEKALIESNSKIESFNQTLEKEIEERTADLVKANQAKDNFLASMSHELRTPLTTIIGNCDHLLEEGYCGQSDCLQSDSIEVLRTIASAGMAQLALINDILDMSKLESGKFTIEEAPYDLTFLLQDIKHMFQTRAADAGLELLIEQQNEEAFLLIGDGQRIGQILNNLLSNALKFTLEGSVSLTTHTEGENILFTVKDTGIGMSPEVIDKLFSRFEQADGTISKRFGGSGLGLYISLNLAELMGGTIDVSSSEGVGSVFQLTLPYKRSELRERRSKRRDELGTVLNEQLNGHVLIAEDTLELQILERRILEAMGLQVTVVKDGSEAVDRATAETFDVILMDMQMPVMDGIEATRALREKKIDTPIIALTANVMKSHKEQFVAAGCNEFIGKPIDKHELKRVLKGHLSRREEVDTDMNTDAEEEVDDELMSIFQESAAGYQKELLDALPRQDWDKIKEIAHPVKGTGSSFGFPNLTEKARLVCDAYDNDQFDRLSQLTQILIEELDSIISKLK